MKKKIKLWEHQEKAVNSVKSEAEKNNGNALGRIVIPTGGGKTVIQATVMDYIMDAYPVHRVHLVVAPRIVLVNQLRQEYSNINNDAGAVVFHSGKAEYDENKVWEEISTTDVNTLKERYTKSHVSKGHNNVTIYGERLFELKPAYLIEQGIIVPPKFHFMFGN